MDSTCSFDGCGRPKNARSLCSGHYRQLRLGEPLHELRAQLPATASLEQRLWDKVERLHDCWEWRGATSDTGYGQFRVKGKTLYVHRVSWEIAGGHLADDVVIDHMCHNRICVRPEHLQAVTHKQNIENSRLSAANTSGARGVSFDRRSGKWIAQVMHSGRNHATTHATREEASEEAIRRRNVLFTNNLLDQRKAG